MKEEGIVVKGKVVESLGDGKFKISLENEAEMIGHLAGKLRQHKIRVIPGDIVDVELSPYDLSRGRIIFRYKK